MVSKPEHHLGERLRHPYRRVIRSGEVIDHDALERGDAELELPDPIREPGEERSEPFGYRDEATVPAGARERLGLYRSFLAEREEGPGQW